MRRGLWLVGGVAVGAGAMYALDPARGRRRRALLRDKAAHNLSRALIALDKAGRDARNRARGVIAEIRQACRCEQVADEVLVERVRANIGHVVAEPHDIEVLCAAGEVTLRGIVPAAEAKRLLRRVAHVRGVSRVESQLKVNRPSGVPTRNTNGNGRGHISPKQITFGGALATVAGAVLASYGARRRGLLGAVVGSLGMRAVTRARRG